MTIKPISGINFLIEFKFLVACCQATPDKNDIDFIEKQLKVLSIKQIILFSTKHAVLPILYTRLKKLAQENKISSFTQLMETLDKHYQFYVKNNIQMSAQLLKMTQLLENNGYHALAFKGPTLAQKAYGNITYRQYVDLDILVDENHVFKVASLLKTEGYSTVKPLSLLQKSTYLSSAKDFSLFHQGTHTELHWRLFENKYNITLEHCLSKEHYQNVKINDQNIKTLENETLLVYLCLHGAKHIFNRLAWICDIDRLIRCDNIDWEKAASIATQARTKRSYLLGLSLAHYLFATPIPPQVIQEISDISIQKLQETTLRHINLKSKETDVFKTNLITFLFQSKLFDSNLEALRFQLLTLFSVSTTDCQTFNLPNTLSFLYILLRPLRLIFSSLSHLLRFILR